MSERPDNRDPDKRDAAEHDDAIARLVQLAGSRAEIPRDLEARVYARVASEWRSATATPAADGVYRKVHREWRKRAAPGWRRRVALPLALAASAVLAVLVVLQPAPPPADTVVARVVKLAGDGLPALGTAIRRGERVSTPANGGLSLRLRDNESLRLDGGTVILFDEANEITLEAGRLYADTGDFVYRDDGLVVSTRFGKVADIGTQFSVALQGDALDVAVREGRVDVDRESRVIVAVAGERMRLAGDGEVDIDSVAPHDEYWDWASELAPSYDIDKRSLYEFLRWAARETGRELEFADEAARLASMRTDLSGSIAGFTPARAIESVLETTRFRYRVEKDRIFIER